MGSWAADLAADSGKGTAAGGGRPLAAPAQAALAGLASQGSLKVSGRSLISHHAMLHCRVSIRPSLTVAQPPLQASSCHSCASRHVKAHKLCALLSQVQTAQRAGALLSTAKKRSRDSNSSTAARGAPSKTPKRDEKTTAHQAAMKERLAAAGTHQVSHTCTQAPTGCREG